MKAGTLIVDIAANLARLQQDMAQVVSVVDSSMKSVQSSVSVAKQALGALSVGLSAVAFKDMVTGTVEAEAGLIRLAQRAASTVEAMSSLSIVAKRSNTDLDSVALGMGKLAKSMAEAGDGTSKAAKVFDVLKISTTDATGALKPAQDVMQELGSKLMSMKDQTLAVAFAQEVLGKNGAALLPFLYELAQAGTLHAKVTAEQAKQAKEFEDRLKTLESQSQAFKRALVNDMLPELIKLTDQFLAAKEAAGGFLGALALFATTSGKDRADPQAALAQQNLSIAGAQRTLDALKGGADDGTFAGGLYSKMMRFGNADDIAIVEQQLVAMQKRKALLEGMVSKQQGQMAGDPNSPFFDFRGGAIPLNVANPLGKDGSGGDGEQMLISLKNQLAEASGEGSVFDRTMRALTEGTKEYSHATITAALALAGEIDEQKAANEAEKEAQKAKDAGARTYQSSSEQVWKHVESLAQENQKLREQVEQIGLTKDQVEALKVKRDEDSLSAAQAALAMDNLRDKEDAYNLSLQQQVKLLTERLALQQQGAQATVAAEAAKAQDDAFKRTAASIDHALTSSISHGIMTGFKSGESPMKAFISTMEAAFASAVLTPILRVATVPISSAIASMLPNYAGAATFAGNAAGGAGGAGALGGLGAMFGQTGADFGNFFGSIGSVAEDGSTFSLFDALGGFAAANPLLAAGIVGGGLLLGNSLFGGGDNRPPGQRGNNWLKLVGGPGSYGVASSEVPDPSVMGSLAVQLNAALNDPAKYDQAKLAGLVGTTVSGQNAGSQSLADLLAQALRPAAEAAQQAAQAQLQTQQQIAADQQTLVQLQAQGNTLIGQLPGALQLSTLEAAKASLATSDFHAPLDRFAAAKGQLETTYASAMGGDLTAAQSFPQVLQGALTVGRDVYASGPQFAELFAEGNRMLNDLLQHQRDVQAELTANIPLAIKQTSSNQVDAIRQQTQALGDQLSSIQAELRRLNAASG